MNHYGWENSPASLTQRRRTRTPGGSLTDREYRARTMLTEDGGIYAIGECDVLDSASGDRFRKAAQVTIPFAALATESDVWSVVNPYLDHLDKLVEGGIPVRIESAPAQAAPAA